MGSVLQNFKSLYFQDDTISSDIKAVSSSRTSHLRTLLFEDCMIAEEQKQKKCDKARDVYKCLLEKFKPNKVFRDAFKRAEKRSEQ